MKRFVILIIVGMLGLMPACGSQEEKASAKAVAPTGKAEKAAPVAPQAAAKTGFVGPIEKLTLDNNFFRQVLFTGKHLQLVVMCLQPGEDIGKEMHPDVDQFFRVEQGQAKFILGEGEKEEHLVGDGDAVIVPAGTYHNVINASAAKPLKLYTVYGPQDHPDGTVQKTKAEAEAAKHH